MPEFVIEKRNIPVLTIASNSGSSSSGGVENALGFRITGGADFEMPITVFQVKEGSSAAKAGLKLGDEIVTINGADASAMRLATAESVIKQAGEQLQLVVTKDQEEDAAPKAAVAAEPTPAVAAEPTPTPAPVENKPKETREIKFAGNDDTQDDDVTNNPSAPKHKPDAGERENWIQPPERKVWHPIVWQQPPPPIPPDVYGKDAPHQQLIANIRRLLKETVSKPEERRKHIDQIMLSLPTGSRPKTEEYDWDEEPPAPEPVKPKKKKAKKGRRVTARKHTESETSEDSITHDLSVKALAAEQIIEEP